MKLVWCILPVSALLVTSVQRDQWVLPALFVQRDTIVLEEPRWLLYVLPNLIKIKREHRLVKLVLKDMIVQLVA